jgi:pimeloyl-ACP methyl ester carboxylesterase
MALRTTIVGMGAPVVLLPWYAHDAAVMALAFEPVFAGTTGLRRIYLNLPGTGGSPAVEPTSDAVLDAVQDAVEAEIGTAPFTLVGCSYGGYLAAGLARRLPDRVQRLALVCSGVRIRPEHRNLDRVLPPIPEPGWLDGAPQRWHDHFTLAIGHQTAPAADRVAEAFRVRGPTDDDYLDRLRASGYPLSDEDSLATYECEVLLVVGRRDQIGGHLDQFDTLDRCPRGSYVALAEAGHYLPFEQPAAFRALMQGWIGPAS